MGNGKFGPDDIITDAQLTTIMNRLTKKNNSTSLTTVDWRMPSPSPVARRQSISSMFCRTGNANTTLSDGLIALADETGSPITLTRLCIRDSPI